jgi:hypothetical protein
MTKRGKNIFFVALFVLANLYSSAQISSPISPSIDTLYLSSGSMTPTIDPNPGTNPFITDSAQTFGRIVANDDPGGPGSGGGTFDPPADAAIPLDGGVAGLVLAGALIGLKRTKKEKELL